MFCDLIKIIQRVAAQAVRWRGIPNDACSLTGWCSKCCDLLPPFTPCNTWSSGGTALCWVGGNGQSLDLPSLTPLSVAAFGRLQLGAPHWASLVALLQVAYNLTHLLW